MRSLLSINKLWSSGDDSIPFINQFLKTNKSVKYLSILHNNISNEGLNKIADALVENKQILGIDEKKVMHNVREVAREVWANVPKRDWLGRGIYDFGPMSIKPFDT